LFLSNHYLWAPEKDIWYTHLEGGVNDIADREKEDFQIEYHGEFESIREKKCVVTSLIRDQGVIV
jgi:hypothetical protein